MDAAQPRPAEIEIKSDDILEKKFRNLLAGYDEHFEQDDNVARYDLTIPNAIARRLLTVVRNLQDHYMAAYYAAEISRLTLNGWLDPDIEIAALTLGLDRARQLNNPLNEFHFSEWIAQRAPQGSKIKQSAALHALTCIDSVATGAHTDHIPVFINFSRIIENHASGDVKVTKLAQAQQIRLTATLAGLTPAPNYPALPKLAGDEPKPN